MMELHRTDIVQVSVQGEQATAVLRPNIYDTSGFGKQIQGLRRTPDFNLVVVTTSDKEGSARMNGNGSYRTWSQVSVPRRVPVRI